MITLTVHTFNGAPTAALSASFDELGGTIGRADNNQLVLPDPERTISRVHAQVAFRNGGFALIDRGSNPVLLNGRPLGNGQEAPLQDGDRVQIGGYVLGVQVRHSPASSPTDPFADLLGFGAAAPAAPPLAPGADPFAFLTSAPAQPAPGDTAPVAAGTTGGIPEDWDPFAPDPAPPTARATSADAVLPDDLGLGLGAAAPASRTPGGLAPTRAEESIDSLFGLGPGHPAPADPLAGTGLQAPPAQPNTAASADPLQALMRPAASGQAPVADHAPELHSPFIAPPLTPAPVSARPAPPSGAGAGASPAAPQGAVLSWGEGSGTAEGRTIIRPAARATPPAPPIAPSADTPASGAPAPSTSAPPLAGTGRAAPGSMPTAPHDVPGAPPQPSAPAHAQALLDALREGLNAPDLRLDTLTPELMKLIGQLLHEATRGTVDLLVARAALKREVRADVTMIMARENNPLKFSPSVDVALNHLLHPPARGFMPAPQAMQDAYEDLRAHQFGFVAGMRAALDGVLKRFDPEQLESKLTQKSMLGSLVPATRKARLWEVFQQLYGQISAEAADDFHELFGKEFLRAYEAHIDQLHQERRR